MEYEGIVYRPPSEANSIILQVTIGCSHNKCSFCTMYKDKKFKIRNVNEIVEEIKTLANQYDSSPKKFFLADGDAFILKTKDLETIILTINKYFPGSRITSYATAQDVIRKSTEELVYLKSIGLYMLYMGIESGSDEVLIRISKGITKAEMISAGKKLKEVGIKQSVMIISGIGSDDLSKEHALESADVVNKIDPEFVSLLTLMVDNNSQIYKKIQAGSFKLLSPQQIMEETLLFIKNLNVTNCIFRSNHASNYVSLSAILPNDKKILIERIENAITSNLYKKEEWRGL